MTDQDDNTLMEQATQGDKTAYEELVVRHYNAGVVFACQIVGDYHMAEDIVQECFAKIYLLRNRYRPAFTFKTYLFTVIRNLSIDYVRKRKKSAAADWDGWDGSCNIENMRQAEETLEEALIDNEEKKALYSHISNLKKEQKQLLYLYAVEELSYKEIARITGQSVGQVKVKLFRCRKILKSKVEEERQNDR